MKNSDPNFARKINWAIFCLKGMKGQLKGLRQSEYLQAPSFEDTYARLSAAETLLTNAILQLKQDYKAYKKHVHLTQTIGKKNLTEIE